MGKLEEIRQRLQDGSTTRELLDDGYARSTIYQAAKKIGGASTGPPLATAPDDFQELRHRKEMVKLQNEIADLEAQRVKLPEKVAALESEVARLSEQLVVTQAAIAQLREAARDAVKTSLMISLGYAGMPDADIPEFTRGRAAKFN